MPDSSNCMIQSPPLLFVKITLKNTFICTKAFVILLINAAVLFFSPTALLQQAYGAEKPYIDLSDQLQYLSSNEQVDSIDQAIDAKEWIALNGDIQLGYIDNKSWFKLEVPKYIESLENPLLELGNSFIEYVTAYVVVDGEVVKEYSSGSSNPMSVRPIDDQKIVFPLVDLRASENSSTTIFLAVSSTSKMFVPIWIWQQDTFLSATKAELLYSGTFLGIVSIIGIFHLFLYFRTRTSFVLFYGIAMLTIFAGYSTRQGLAYTYLWAENPITAIDVVSVTRPIIFACLVILLADLAELVRIKPVLYKISVAIAGCLVLIALLPLTPLVNLNLIPSGIYLAIYAYLFPLSVWLIYKKQTMGKYFVACLFISLTAFSLSFALASFKSTIPYADHVNSMGVILIIIVLASAVAQKIRDNELRATNNLKALNLDLEQKVAARTQSLRNTMKNLISTQKNLIETEKVASMTSLIGGIAQEMDQPLLTSSQLTTQLKIDNQEMSELLNENKVRRKLLLNHFEKTRDALQVVESKLEQTAHLVAQFKNIAIDSSKSTAKPCNLKTEISDAFAFSTRWMKERPAFEIDCDERLTAELDPVLLRKMLNQMIENSLLHAFTNIEEGQIKVTATWNEATKNIITLCYSDNGKGLNPNLSDRLFEAFETTAKEQGKHGLGTTAIYNIAVYGLKGEISYNSESGKGLAYTIKIPAQNFANVWTKDAANLRT